MNIYAEYCQWSLVTVSLFARRRTFVVLHSSIIRYKVNNRTAKSGNNSGKINLMYVSLSTLYIIYGLVSILNTKRSLLGKVLTDHQEGCE